MTDILEVRGLKVHFPIRGGLLNRKIGEFRAVNDVSFRIPRGKTFGLVGESGSGKTTIGKSILHLLPPTAGSIRFKGTELTELKAVEMRAIRSQMQMIYQAPAASLNRRMTIGQIVSEALWLHENLRGAAQQRRALDLLREVGLQSEHFYRYPHEFSGGQQQRVGIARALAVQPELLILDEPTSALDVSVQAQILNLLQRLQDEYSLTYMFISHDLSVVRYMCDEIGLLYLGKLVEVAAAEVIFESPRHPYTQALISAIPEPDPESQREEILLQGELGQVGSEHGCPFAPRCFAEKLAECTTVVPALLESSAGHQVACHLHPEKAEYAS